MHRDDLDLAAARDAVLRCRGKDLDGSVIREPDRATSARPDAHCDHRVTPDELRERCWPVPLSAAERREDPERRACPGDAESDADEQLVDRFLLERRAHEAPYPEHREETEEDRRCGRVVTTQEGKVHAEET